MNYKLNFYHVHKIKKNFGLLRRKLIIIFILFFYFTLGIKNPEG